MLLLDAVDDMKIIILAIFALLFLVAPSHAAKNPDGVAVIIGNKNYQGDIPSVDFAHNDADAIRQYVLDVLGYDPDNIIDLRDASKAKMEAAFGNKDNHGVVIFSRLFQVVEDTVYLLIHEVNHGSIDFHITGRFRSFFC